MRNRALFAAFALALVFAPTATAQYQFKDGYPTPETTQRVGDDADMWRAIIAYRFWYPTVSCEGILNGTRAAGVRDNQEWAILSASPKQSVFTAYSDTPYGSAVLDLSKGPMVIQLPPGPYIGLVNDHLTGCHCRRVVETERAAFRRPV